jgi:hypothetical protein
MSLPVEEPASVGHVSQDPAVSLAQIADSFICESVEVSGADIGLELPVPGGGVEIEKPIAQGGKLLLGKPADGGFDLVNGAHRSKIDSVQIRNGLGSGTHQPRCT